MLMTTALALAEGGSNINPNASLVVILVLFLFFIFVLNRILFRPIGRVLDEREARTVGATAEARASARRYEARLADYEAAIRQARAEGFRTQEQSRAAALDERRRLLDEAKSQASGEIDRAKTDIARQAAEARGALEADARRMAESISRTVLGRTVGGGVD